MQVYVILLLAIMVMFATATEPNPPNWNANTKIFSPGNDGTTQGIINQIFQENGGPPNNQPFHGEWSNSRYALLFQPGTYHVDVPVGYYTQVMGMGQTPSATYIDNVYSQNGNFDFQGGALANFWRSAENFQTTPRNSWFGNTAMLWAVSQASPLRKVTVNGDLLLFEYNYGSAAGYASGGYMADMHVTGKVMSGSQQQWFTRNANLGSWDGGVWNMVWVGSTNAPGDHCSNNGGIPANNIPATEKIAEKPYISYNNGRYYLQIPPLETNKVGASPEGLSEQSVDFNEVYVTQASDTAQDINRKLSAGIKYLVISPGIYQLSEPIKIINGYSVILGLGFPTLIPTTGKEAIEIANVPGVRVSGVLLEAGLIRSSTLLKVGDGNHGSHDGESSSPTILQDLFARVGGPNNEKSQPTATDSMVEINSNNVIIDNSWLWRADHSVVGLVTNGDNPVDSALVVNGDNVIAYGLAAEHTLKDLVVWNGNNGKVYFYQSELPYDVTSAYGDAGYAGFTVGNNVENFHGYGMGVYSYFRDHDVTVQSGIKAPSKPGVQFHNSLTVWLNGGGRINHVVNNEGETVSGQNEQKYLCDNIVITLD